jgi:phosphoglycolate phosphatase
MNDNIRMIVFDWDGTLVDSMGTKAQSFAESIIRSHPSLQKYRNDIQKTYFATRGTSRLDQLALVLNTYSCQQLSEPEKKQWSDLFTSLYSSVQSPLFSYTGLTLSELSHKYSLAISSSVPQADLIRTIEPYNLSRYFSYVLGFQSVEFKKGIGHFKYISEQSGLPLECMAMVGDGPEDIKVAHQAGVYAIGKADERIPASRDDLLKENPAEIINNINELVDHLAHLTRWG